MEESNIVVTEKERELSPEKVRETELLKRRFARLKTGKYLKELPSIYCENCPMGKEQFGKDYPCKEYKKGSVCFYYVKIKKMIGEDIRNASTVKQLMWDLISVYAPRVWLSLRTENVQGGVLEKDTDRISKFYFDMLKTMHELEEPRQNVQLIKQESVKVENKNYPIEFMRKVFARVNEENKEDKDG